MRKLLKHVVLFISVLVICPWTQGMKPLTDKQLGHVVGNQPYYLSSYSLYPKNPPPDFFSARRKTQRTICKRLLCKWYKTGSKNYVWSLCHCLIISSHPSRRVFFYIFKNLIIVEIYHMRC